MKDSLSKIRQAAAERVGAEKERANQKKRELQESYSETYKELGDKLNEFMEAYPTAEELLASGELNEAEAAAVKELSAQEGDTLQELQAKLIELQGEMAEHKEVPHEVVRVEAQQETKEKTIDLEKRLEEYVETMETAKQKIEQGFEEYWQAFLDHGGRNTQSNVYNRSWEGYDPMSYDAELKSLNIAIDSFSFEIDELKKAKGDLNWLAFKAKKRVEGQVAKLEEAVTMFKERQKKIAPLVQEAKESYEAFSSLINDQIGVISTARQDALNAIRQMDETLDRRTLKEYETKTFGNRDLYPEFIEVFDASNGHAGRYDPMRVKKTNVKMTAKVPYETRPSVEDVLNG